jgi:hypothetical protein
MTIKEPTENQTFSIRFYNHLKRYYMIFGIVGLIIAGTIGFSLLIGFITFNLIVPIAQLIPPWGYAVVGVVSLPAILALIHTFVEIDTMREPITTMNKKYPRFKVEIEKTVYNWSYVYLRAYKWGGYTETIAFESCIPNNEVQSVANELLKNAETIYDKQIGKISGTFEKPLCEKKISDDPLTTSNKKSKNYLKTNQK